MTNSSERSKAYERFEDDVYRPSGLEAKMSSDEWNVAVLLRKRSRTTEDVAYLVNMLYEYCFTPELGRNSIPTDLLQYVARELKKYVTTRNYKPFPALQGRKTDLPLGPIPPKVRESEVIVSS